MSNRIQAIRGMNDVLPDKSMSWQFLEENFSRCLNAYGYQEIRLPILESTQLFKRSIGEITDVVEKEMYTFDDLNGDSLSLRPEGTAGCVRACLEHGLLHNQQQKLWYIGPMFRHEKPQKGRYRQFTQMGVEAFGISGPAIELELIAMTKRLWEILGIGSVVTLEINTLGTLEERQTYRATLVEYFKPHFDDLDDDSKHRLYKNPLRILDSKHPQMQTLIAGAPKLHDVIGEESRQHFQMLCQGLDALKIAYKINPLLVRGLDYYGHTVFEWVTDKLGSQATVCAGGRFDKLVEQLGGKACPAVGFAMGAERLLLLMDELSILPDNNTPPSVFFIPVGDEAMQRALVLAESLRTDRKDWQVIVNTAGGSVKNQFKKADKSGARIALILGIDEMREHTISIKDLRRSGEQVTIAQDQLNHYINATMGE